MPYFKTTRGIKLFYEYFPQRNRPTLVFIHGLGSDHSSWSGYIQHFRKKYGIVAMDLRGFGKSDKLQKKEEYQLHYFVDDLAQLLTSLKLKNYCLIGHSLGGIIILKSRIKPKLKPTGIVLMGTPKDYTDITHSFIAQIHLSRVFPHRLYKILDNSRGYAEAKNSFLFKIKCLARNDLKSSLFILDNLRDYSFTGKMKSRNLVILSDNDEIIKNHIRQLYPNSITIPGKHLAFLLKPEVVFPLIEKFVGKNL